MLPKTASNASQMKSVPSEGKMMMSVAFRPSQLSHWQRVRHYTLKGMQSSVFTAIMLAATVFALWGQDTYYIISPSISNDLGVSATIFVCFLLFFGEFFVQSVCKDGYPLSFFFWLDLVAAISLLPDVLVLFNNYSLTGSSAGSSVTLARAGRAARAGTRAARIVRVIKLLSLLKKKKTEGDEVLESKIGGQLADLITQKVIIIVGAMLISTSLLDLISTTTDYTFLAELGNLESVWDFGLANNRTDIIDTYLSRFIIDHDVFAFTNDDFSINRMALSTLISGSASASWPPVGANWMNNDNCKGRSLRYLSVLQTDVWCNSKNADDLRSVNSEFESYETSRGTKMILDQKKYARGQSLVNVIQILFIVLLLGISSALFNHDAETLVIRPLAKMANLVRKMSANPLAEIVDSGEGGDYETDFVESALKKFGKLLQVAFGEAGAEIIGANMSNGGELNLMIAGRKLDAIFGFVVIFHFSECTECLQEDIMSFVNQVAEYIHIAVSQNEGFTNKNIGEAWLLAWRMPEKFNPSNFTKADSALKSFIKVALQTWLCPKIRALTEHPKIQEKLPGYRIHMGFGLHVGWAIQGAIGSPQKIDASFLSPNVNLASRLEAANHQFHTCILFSGQIHQLLSPRVQILCRKVDRVTVKGSALPLEIWTYDVPFDLYENIEDLTPKEGENIFDHCPPWTTQTYRNKYAMVIEHYLAGKWDRAQQLLSVCLEENPSDGPANALNEIMSAADFKAPDNWPGYRALTDK